MAFHWVAELSDGSIIEQFKDGSETLFGIVLQNATDIIEFSLKDSNNPQKTFSVDLINKRFYESGIEISVTMEKIGKPVLVFKRRNTASIIDGKPIGPKKVTYIIGYRASEESFTMNIEEDGTYIGPMESQETAII